MQTMTSVLRLQLGILFRGSRSFVVQQETQLGWCPASLFSPFYHLVYVPGQLPQAMTAVHPQHADDVFSSYSAPVQRSRSWSWRRARKTLSQPPPPRPLLPLCNTLNHRNSLHSLHDDQHQQARFNWIELEANALRDAPQAGSLQAKGLGLVSATPLLPSSCTTTAPTLSEPRLSSSTTNETKRVLRRRRSSSAASTFVASIAASMSLPPPPSSIGSPPPSPVRRLKKQFGVGDGEVDSDAEEMDHYPRLPPSPTKPLQFDFAPIPQPPSHTLGRSFSTMLQRTSHPLRRRSTTALLRVHAPKLGESSALLRSSSDVRGQGGEAGGAGWKKELGVLDESDVSGWRTENWGKLHVSCRVEPFAAMDGADSFTTPRRSPTPTLTTRRQRRMCRRRRSKPMDNVRPWETRRSARRSSRSGLM